jgi:putative chitinase
MRSELFVNITPALLRRMSVDMDRAQRFATPLEQTMGQYGIVGPQEQAHFLGQVFTESGLLRYTEEIWGPTQAQRRYDIRPDLGNTIGRDGDGEKYRGRGLIQVTGKDNYERFGKHIKNHHGMRYDLVEDPSPVAEAPLNCMCAGWYWDSHGLSQIAGRGTELRYVRMVTEVVNGGHNHLKKRVEHTQNAYEYLLGALQVDVNRKVPVFSAETAEVDVEIPHKPIETPDATA